MLKKLLRILTAHLVLFVAFSPLRALAQIFKGSGGSGVTDTEAGVDKIERQLKGSGVASTDSVSDLILKFINFALPFLALGAFVGFVYAGFLYVTAYGNDEQVTKAKKIMIYVAIGLVVVIISYSVVRLFTEGLVGALNQGNSGNQPKP